MQKTLLLILLSVFGLPSTAHAQGDGRLPPELVDAVGSAVLEELTDDEVAFLLAACPQEEVDALVACVKTNPAAVRIVNAARRRAGDEEAEPRSADAAAHAPEDAPGDIPTAAAPGAAPPAAGAETDYSTEALALLPREALDALPKMLTRFLRPADYGALKEACPQTELEAVLGCLDTEQTGELLDVLLSRSVLAQLLALMDVELPDRLTPEEIDGIAAGCAEQGGAWGKCAFDAKPSEADECLDEEDALARCAVDDDRVGEVFLEIQKDKKAAFGPELYVELRGLLSLLPMDVVKAVREACPQADRDALFACLSENDVVNGMVAGFSQIAAGLVSEAQAELTAAGAPLDDAQLEATSDKALDLLLTLPLHVVQSIGGECERSLGVEELTSPAQLEALLACMKGSSATDPVANPAYISKARLGSWLGLARTKVVDVIRHKEEQKQDQSFVLMLYVLAGLTLLGLLFILLLPVRLGRKHPDRGSVLWKAAGVAAMTFVGTMVLLGATLLVMRTVQSSVATDSTSPKMRVAQAVFDVLERDDYVEQLSDLSKERLDFIKTPLRAVLAETKDAETAEDYAVFAAHVAEHWANLLNEPELKYIAKNVELLKAQAATFKSVLGFYRKVDWIMGLVPILLALLVVILYLMPMRETLVEIATGPAAAATSERDDTASKGIRLVKGELKLLLPYVLTILVFLPATGFFLAIAVEPLVELLLNSSLLTVFYILLNEASGAVLYLSIGGTVLLLVFAIVVYILTMAFFVGAMRKILRARFHWGQSLRDHDRFWLWGTLSSLWLLFFPVAVALLIIALGRPFLDGLEIDQLGALEMLTVPIGGVVGFALLFWLLRCSKALRFLKGYKVEQQPGGPSAGG